MSWLLITYQIYKAGPYKEEMIDDDMFILFKKCKYMQICPAKYFKASLKGYSTNTANYNDTTPASAVI